MSTWQNPTLFEDSELKNTIGGMLGIALLVMSSAMLAPQRAFAASSAGCVGGGFSVLGLSGDQRTIVAAGKVDRGLRYVGRAGLDAHRRAEHARYHGRPTDSRIREQDPGPPGTHADRRCFRQDCEGVARHLTYGRRAVDEDPGQGLRQRRRVPDGAGPG